MGVTESKTPQSSSPTMVGAFAPTHGRHGTSADATPEQVKFSQAAYTALDADATAEAASIGRQHTMAETARRLFESKTWPADGKDIDPIKNEDWALVRADLQGQVCGGCGAKDSLVPASVGGCPSYVKHAGLPFFIPTYYSARCSKEGCTWCVKYT